MGKSAWLVLVSGALCVACGGDGAAVAPSEASSATIAPEPAPPRRPTRRFYLARSAERCEIYAEDGLDRSEPVTTPCPEILLIGERIRVAGMTCILENKAQPEREKPTVCPDPLTHFEKTVRGEGK
jgi:hypothetical protein